jgi:hypothetical protein
VGLNIIQSGGQVFHQIGGIFQAHGQPHHAITNADLGAFLRPDGPVSGGGGMGDQAFGIA